METAKQFVFISTSYIVNIIWLDQSLWNVLFLNFEWEILD